MGCTPADASFNCFLNGLEFPINLGLNYDRHFWSKGSYDSTIKTSTIKMLIELKGIPMVGLTYQDWFINLGVPR